MSPSRRQFIAGALGASFTAMTTPANAQNTNVIAPNRDIKGSLEGLTMRPGQSWPNDTLKLVYFGMPWNTGCSADLLVIDAVVKKLAAQGLKVTPVFVYPHYTKPNLPHASILQTYIRPPSSPFIEVYGPPEKVTQVAANYRARYFDPQGKPIAPDNTQTLPVKHSRFTYLMDTHLRNLAIFPSDPLDVEMEREIRKHAGVTSKLSMNLER